MYEHTTWPHCILTPRLAQPRHSPPLPLIPTQALTLTALLEEHIEPLAEALRTNRVLRKLTLIHAHKSHTAEVSLPVQQVAALDCL